MIKSVHAIVDVLLGNIIFNNKLLPVVKQSYPYDKTPCVTLDDSASVSTLQKQLVNKKVRLHHFHPQFELYKKSLVPQQVIKETKQSNININVWCDTEREREVICNNILDLFYKAQSDHYMFCKNYDNGICSFLDGECLAIGNDNRRSVKNQCPSPEEYNYCNLFEKYDIDRNTFNVESPFSLDDLGAKKPVLRSVIKVSMVYYDYYVVGGGISQNIEFDEDLL